MKAKLLFHEKNEIQDRYIVEYSLHEVGVSDKYPDGVKYGIICFDMKTRRRVLMDNHHPKGPHIHLDDEEIAYNFRSIEKLIEDFKQLVFSHLGVRL